MLFYAFYKISKLSKINVFLWPIRMSYLSIAWVEILCQHICTRGIHSFVVLYWGLRWIAEGAYFASIAPKAVISWILLLYKLVIVDVGGEVGMRLRAIAVFSDLSKGTSEFVLACFSWDIAAVTWHLCSWIRLTHDNIYNFQWCL